MTVVGRENLREFLHRHADVRSQIGAWLREVAEAQWEGPQDIKDRYANVSFLSENRVVFNIKGNKYRLDTKIS